MIVFTENTINKSSFSSTNFNTSITAPNVKTSLSAVSFVNNIGIDIPTRQISVFNLEIREKNSVSSINLSRESSMASSKRSTLYYDRINTDIDCNPTIKELSLELSYETKQEKALWVGMVANHQKTMKPLNVYNEAPPTHTSYKDDIINIQLPYDPQASTEPESGSFYPISLHSSIEHFASDFKNIKVILNFLAKYIQNKQINGGKGNDLNDFDSIGDAI